MAGKHKFIEIVNGLLSACPCWIVIVRGLAAMMRYVESTQVVRLYLTTCGRGVDFWSMHEHFLINLDEGKQLCTTGTTNSSQ